MSRSAGPKYDYLLVIGPGRSGTRFLLANLETHPELDTTRGEGAYYYRSRRRLRKAVARSGNDANGRRIVVDVANLAYKDPALTRAVPRLRRDGFRILLVALVRDHRHRAVSVMRFRRSRGQPSAWFGARCLELAALRDRLRPAHLRRLMRLDADLMVVPFATLTDQASSVLRALSAQCGIAEFGPARQDVVNETVEARFLPLAALGTALAVVLRRLGLREPLRRIKHAPLAKSLLFRPADKSRYGLGSETQELLATTYDECVALMRESSSRIENVVYVHRAQPLSWVADGPPLVSVVIPARNAEATISATIDSVLSQGYDGPLEVIVADGSETPALSAIIRRLYPGVRLVPNPERTTSCGLNAALGVAAGEVVVRCDAHTVLPAGYVRRAVDTLERTGAASVGGRQHPVGTTFFERAVAMAMTTLLGSGGVRYKLGGVEGPVDSFFLGAYRRQALDAVGGFDATLIRNQDYELNWRFRERGELVWFDPQMAAIYKPRSSVGSLARQYWDYGQWKRVVLTRHPFSFKTRHFAAPLLMLALGASALLALVGAPASVAAVAPLAYVGALVVESSIAGVRRRDWAGLLLPLVLATMHCSWGTGFLFPSRPKGSTSTSDRAGSRHARPGVKNPATQLKCMVASAKGSPSAAGSPRRKPTTKEAATSESAYAIGRTPAANHGTPAPAANADVAKPSKSAGGAK